MDKSIIKQEIFYFLSAALCSFILMEIFWPRVVLAYLNLNWLLLIWLVSAISLLRKR